jgi:hypothetical protein
LSGRLRDRHITAGDLDRLRIWVESQPEVPEEDWYKNFGSFKICGRGPDPVTFLEAWQEAWGREIDAEADEAEA